jgi:O-antigen ligase
LLHPDKPKHVVIIEGQVTKISLAEFNQSVAILMFNLWPGLLASRTVESTTRRAILVGLLLLAVAVPVLVSEHDSSQLALIGSLLIFSLAWMWRRQVIRALAFLWCMAFVLALPLSFFAYKAELHMAPWLPESARARVIIWEYTAERVLDHPWLGIGADSTRALRGQRETSERPEGFIFKRTTAWHAHDLFLQVWYELGLVGVILIGLAGAAVALRMSVLPFESQPFAAATFAVFMAIAAFAWGIWQTWLICAVLLRGCSKGCRRLARTQVRTKPAIHGRGDHIAGPPAAASRRPSRSPKRSPGPVREPSLPLKGAAWQPPSFRPAARSSSFPWRARTCSLFSPMPAGSSI